MISPRIVKLSISSAILALLFILLSPSSNQNELSAREYSVLQFEIPVTNTMFHIGEELHYNVSYSVFDIGLVKITVIDTATKNGVKVYIAKAFLDSYSGLPFVDLHQVFYSEMNNQAFSQIFSTHNTAKPKEMPFFRYVFDYQKNKMQYVHGIDPQGTIAKSGEIAVLTPQLDGLSLFYYARNNFRQVKKYSIPVFVSEKSYSTHFNFMNKVGSQEIDAVKYPVETIEFDGSSDFTGVFGLTGYFKGFFSNDDAGVPIVAKMKVILGSVHIELIKWVRPGWIPPRGK